MGWHRSARVVVVVVLGVIPAACSGTLYRDYEARPVLERGEQEESRVVVERAGVRATAGPPSEFPYVLEASGRASERGRYQLFTRVRIENRRADAVEVLWPEARIEVPDGAALSLVDSGSGEAGAAAAEPAAAAVERLAPGGAAARALIPESLRTIEVDEPLVSLCDGCEYRLVVPVRVGGRRELLVLPFRLEAERRRGDGVRFLFWD